MTKPPAPDDLLKIIRWICTARCTCIVCGLQCTTVCTGCMGVSCQKPCSNKHGECPLIRIFDMVNRSICYYNIPFLSTFYTRASTIMLDI